jgi:hypothetical protein
VLRITNTVLLSVYQRQMILQYNKEKQLQKTMQTTSKSHEITVKNKIKIKIKQEAGTPS